MDIAAKSHAAVRSGPSLPNGSLPCRLIRALVAFSSGIHLRRPCLPAFDTLPTGPSSGDGQTR